MASRQMLPVKCVKLRIPQKSFRRLFNSGKILSRKKTFEVKRRIKEAEDVKKQVLHYLSVLEVLLLRHYE